MSLGRFTCNICAAANDSAAPVNDREQSTCTECRSSIRFRSLMLALSRALFGLDLPMTAWPRLESVRGMGMSDSDIYAPRLENLFSYTNTFLHQEPRFDLSRPDASHDGQYDFVICSDVLEHIPAPVDDAFATLARLLKPAGVLILTTPYGLDVATLEHFPPLRETGLARVGDRLVLVNRTAEGGYQVFDDLVFHGGDGSTLEMRAFSEADLRQHLRRAGLERVHFDTLGNPEFGVVYNGPCSLPIAASREEFRLSRDGVMQLAHQYAEVRAILDQAERSRWMKLGRRFGVGPARLR